MSPIQLRSFHAVATTGSFTAAARMLRVSQPTVTTQVKALEELYGAELFYRRSRGAEPTAVGRNLLSITQRIVAGQQEAEDYLKEVAGLQSGHLRLGAVGPFQVTEILALFNAQYPGISVSVTSGNSRVLEESLRNYHSDIAVVGRLGDLGAFHAIHYSRPAIVIVVNQGHPWSKRKSIRINELKDQRMVFREEGSETRRILEEAAKSASVPLSNIMEFRGRDGVLAAVARGIGIGAVSEEEFVDLKALRKIHIADAEMHTNVHVICLKERKDARMIKAFMDTALQLVKLPARTRRPSA